MKIKEKGITLIALVITIIVLLILAGVSIAMLTGENGILTQANNSKIEQSHGAVKEGMSLAYNEYQIEINTASNGKLASTETGTIKGKEEKAVASYTSFLDFLNSKGYIKEGTTDVLNVEKLTGGKQALGNGTDTDIYKIEEQDNTYIVNYYSKDETTNLIWSTSDNTEVGSPTLEPDTGKEALILVYNVLAGDTIELPYNLETLTDTQDIVNAKFDFTVDWGDGNTDTITNADIEAKAIHQYTESGEKTVKITGTFESMVSRINDSSSNQRTTRAVTPTIVVHQGIDRLVRVEQWGKTQLKTLALTNCPNLTKIAEPTQNSFKDLLYVKFSESALQSIPENLFANSPNVINFADTFSGTEITSIPEKLFANCSNVTDFTSTFERTLIASIPENLFANCSNVTDFTRTFGATPTITSIPEGLFKNCSKVTSFSHTFYNTGITSIPEKLFTNCPNVTDFSSAFSGTQITSIPENLFANCPNVTDFSSAFSGTAITSIPENLFANCSNVTDFSSAFSGTPITSIPEHLFDKCNNIRDIIFCFSNCKNLTGNAPELWLREINGRNCFYNCTNLDNYDEIPDFWKNDRRII